ncbi:hypothetical protein [Polynucleobacter asymbioticus]|uniref:Collagen triple helix repeat n=1 Tax=Polynucleobacter asymbioticus TaxID=576611 RepID=A0AAC9IRG1_9BURK|nr:hypothetical protein [Polynucleobacter asymbioticus]APC01324.1 hypothetical protein AOC25_06720 [Polynucleobacter asymbioticus]
MQRYTNILVNGFGNVVAGASVQVLTMPSGSLASIYSDDGITSASNPLISDVGGSFTFYAADGTYSLLISGNGIQSETVTNIILTSPLYGPTGPQGNSITGPTGPASTVAGPTGPVSTVAGPTGPVSTVAGPTGPVSTTPGPTGPTGAASAVAGPTGPTGSATMTYPGAGIAVSTGSAWGTPLIAPSGAIVGTTDFQTLSLKRVTPRAVTTTSSATPTINTDSTDIYGLTAQAVNITSFTTNLSGTPTDGQKLWIYIVGTAARTIAWGTSFEASTVALPTTTVTTNRLDVGFVWNAATLKWRCVAVA